MKIHPFLAAAILIACACVGYYGGVLRQLVPHFLASRDIPSVDYFVTRETFSEIENAKAQLEGLSLRFLTESRDRRFEAIAQSTKASAKSCPNATQLAKVVEELERAIVQFSGTDQQLLLVQDLLWLLKQQNRFDRWIDVYLEALYQHPTNPLSGRFAREALQIAHKVRRDADVMGALRHVLDIPMDFDGKGTIRALLTPGSAQLEIPNPGEDSIWPESADTCVAKVNL